MCEFERLTTSRVARCSAMRARVLRERRTRASFLFIDTSFSLAERTHAPRRLLLLRFLDHDSLVGVTHALALVRLGRTIGADLRRNLADLLLVDTLDDYFRLHRRRRRHTLRHLVHDRVR